MKKSICRSLLIVFILPVFVFANAATEAGTTFDSSRESSQPTQQVHSQASTWVDSEIKNFDCAQINALGIDQQLNLRASLIRIHCGQEQFAGVQSMAGVPSGLMEPSNFSGVDAQVNNALADTYPHVTQNTSSFAAKGPTVVAVYNSSTDAPSNLSGISYSQDGGSTFTEIRPSPFATGHGTNYGDPMIVNDYKAGSFEVIWLVSGGDCGAQGIGLWSSEDGVNWQVGSCVHIGKEDDRAAMWVDNSPTSPYYGRIYVTWNNFDLNGGALQLSYSVDNGVTWSVPVTVNPSFLRNEMGVSRMDGNAYLAALDEGGGGTNPRQNWIFTSTDGGLTWSSSTMGNSFTAPGDFSCDSYFRAINPIWRYMGWGSLAADAQGGLHYVYTAGASGDAGNILYMRSADGGATWTAPIQLNTDSSTRAQWMPSITISANGKILVAWYDRRNTNNYDYQRFAKVSVNDGVSWQADQLLSDQIIPQPAQPDPLVAQCYAGDYDQATTFGTVAIGGWVDGRVPISNTAQQDIYAHPVNLAAQDVCVSAGTAWQLIAGLPVAVYGPAVTHDSTYVYAAAGFNKQLGLDENQFVRYDPTTNSWSELAPLPTAVNNAAAAYVNGKIYIFGGISNGNLQSLTQIYTISTNSWSNGASMPDIRSHMGVGTYKGKIYLVGGYNSITIDLSSTKAQNWLYDPVADNWTVMAPIPSALGGPASGVINGILYIAGGRDVNNLALNTLYAYNISLNSWSTRAPLLTAVNLPGGTAYSGDLWVMGGGMPFLSDLSVPDDSVSTSVPESVAGVQIYDPKTDSWRVGPAQNVARSMQGASVAGGVIISVGGFSGYSTAVSESFLQQRLNVLLVNADDIPPLTLQTQLLGYPNVAAVDFYNAMVSTPSLAQLQKYDMVVTWSNFQYDDPITLGNELADYVDGGGVVVELSFDWRNSDGYHLDGRWVTSGYSTFNFDTGQVISTTTLSDTYVLGSPLLADVSNLSVKQREVVTATNGSTLIAGWSDNSPALAVKNHVVGVNGYFGDDPPAWSGEIGTIITNSGFSLRKSNVTCNTIPFYLPIAMNNY